MTDEKYYTKSTLAIVEAILAIPYGRVDTYGRVALRAGIPKGARQVVRILSSLSDKLNLPWHRVVNAQYKISLKGQGSSIQRALLEGEGVEFQGDRIDKASWYLPI